MDMDKYSQQPWKLVAPLLIPKKFKMPDIPKYDGTSDPRDHVTAFFTGVERNDLTKQEIESGYLTELFSEKGRQACTKNRENEEPPKPLSQKGCMENIVDRYNDKVPDSSEHATVENVEEPDEMNALKAEVAKLRQETGRMMGKELEGMNFKELQKLEHQLTEGILFVKNKKEQVLLELLEKSRLQIEELGRSSCNHYSVNNQAANKISGGSSTLVCDSKSDSEEDSDTSLRLGLSVATS
ncbi:agamous-like MADS-box protein AGL15 [Nicotiana tabacum]|uniref:Agamous-like MADS-box protein AGL15 n=1 Tax=Nicotiana tabacum TaxID=4097 RepID=A0AC58U2Y5_TOBAC